MSVCFKFWAVKTTWIWSFFLSYFPPFQCMRVYEHINQSIWQKQILTKYLIIRNEGRERRLIKASEVDEYCIHSLISALVLGQGAPRARYGKGERVFSMKMQFAFFKRETMNVKLVVWNRCVLLCRWTYAMKRQIVLISAHLNLSNGFRESAIDLWIVQAVQSNRLQQQLVTAETWQRWISLTQLCIRFELMRLYTRVCQQNEEWASEGSVHTEMKNLSSFIHSHVTPNLFNWGEFLRNLYKVLFYAKSVHIDHIWQCYFLIMYMLL